MRKQRTKENTNPLENPIGEVFWFTDIEVENLKKFPNNGGWKTKKSDSNAHSTGTKGSSKKS